MPTAQSQLSDEDIVRFLGGLWQLNRRMKQDIEPLLEKWQLDIRHFFLLVAVGKGTVYPKELSEKLQIPSTLLSRYLDTLVKRGLLERQIDPHDSRRTRLNLTPLGTQRVQSAVAEIKTYTSRRLQDIEPAKLLAMLGAMEALGSPRDPTPPTPPSRENR